MLSQTLKLSDGTSNIVKSSEDFEKLIEKYMGGEAADFYRDQLVNLTQFIDDTGFYIDIPYWYEKTEEVIDRYGYK